jgi:toxin ParE1/3/4
MAFKLIWSPTARLDLKDLSEYIAEENAVAAKKFVSSIFEVVERLMEFPESGRIVPEFGDTKIREIIRRPCRIVYRLKSDKQMLEIVRIWHSARGIPRL